MEWVVTIALWVFHRVDLSGVLYVWYGVKTAIVPVCNPDFSTVLNVRYVMRTVLNFRGMRHNFVQIGLFLSYVGLIPKGNYIHYEETNPVPLETKLLLRLFSHLP
jgi:hypothetical protein